MVAKPNMREFMDATGADAATASELLYGVVGANRDTRDWGAIMSSSNPVAAATQATGAMYAGPEATQATRESGRYVSITPSAAAPSLVRYYEPDLQRDLFAIVAADGTPLRAGFGTEEQARAQGQVFGISGDVGTGTFARARVPEPAPVAAPAPQSAMPIASAVPSPLAAPSTPMFASETLGSMAVPQFQQPTALPPLQALLSPPAAIPKPAGAPQFQQPMVPTEYAFQRNLPPQPGLPNPAA